MQRIQGQIWSAQQMKDFILSVSSATNQNGFSLDLEMNSQINDNWERQGNCNEENEINHDNCKILAMEEAENPSVETVPDLLHWQPIIRKNKVTKEVPAWRYTTQH